MEEEEEAEYEEEYADYEEEEEGEGEQNGYELEGNVAVLDEETAVDYSAMCPGEEDMTPQGLATLKRLEAFLCNGEEQNQVVNPIKKSCCCNLQIIKGADSVLHGKASAKPEVRQMRPRSRPKCVKNGRKIERKNQTSDAGSQYRCGRVGRGIQPPSIPSRTPGSLTHTDS